MNRVTVGVGITPGRAGGARLGYRTNKQFRCEAEGPSVIRKYGWHILVVVGLGVSMVVFVRAKSKAWYAIKPSARGGVFSRWASSDQGIHSRSYTCRPTALPAVQDLLIRMDRPIA